MQLVAKEDLRGAWAMVDAGHVFNCPDHMVSIPELGDDGKPTGKTRKSKLADHLIEIGAACRPGDYVKPQRRGRKPEPKLVTGEPFQA